MVLAPERVIETVAKPAFTEPQVEEPKVEDSIDEAATLKFIEDITGRKIREQVIVNHAKIQSGESPVYGKPVGQYVNALNDNFRDHPDFDVIVGSSHTRVNNRFYYALQFQVRPGLSELDIAMLAGSIPASVPLETKIVVREQDLLTPQLASQRRVTHNNHRLLPGEDPRLRIR